MHRWLDAGLVVRNPPPRLRFSSSSRARCWCQRYGGLLEPCCLTTRHDDTCKKPHKTKTHPDKTAHTRGTRRVKEVPPPACSFLLVSTSIFCCSEHQVGGGGVSKTWSTCCRHSWLFVISAQRQQPRRETHKKHLMHQQVSPWSQAFRLSDGGSEQRQICLEWRRRENTSDQRWENQEKSLVGQQIRVMWPHGRSSLAGWGGAGLRG